jgi:hypothetical protein
MIPALSLGCFEFARQCGSALRAGRRECCRKARGSDAPSMAVAPLAQSDQLGRRDMERVPPKARPAVRMDLPSGREVGGQSTSDDDQIHSARGHEVISDSASKPTQILFIDDVAALLRVSRSTIERRRREGTFPIPELPGLDCRPRWSRVAVERFLASPNGRFRKHRRESSTYR